MLFSIIVPIYKVEKYLKDCIESVLNQSFSDFELILVDDGSPDKCPEICNKYKAIDSRIKVIHKENGGLASARRAGIKIASGDYVFNLDSDDTIELDTLEYASKIIADTDCDIISFAYKWVDNNIITNITNDPVDEGFYTRSQIEEIIYPRLLMDKDMNHISYYLSGKAVKRSLLTPIQLSVSPSISLGEDLCCVVPCYMRAKSVFISKKCAYLYAVRNDSISKKFNAKQICMIEDVINTICKYKDNIPHDFEKQLCRYSCFMCFAILASAAEGNHFESISEIKKYILNSVHSQKIPNAKFENISAKSRISVFLLKRNLIKTAFYFLNLCKVAKKILKKG